MSSMSETSGVAGIGVSVGTGVGDGTKVGVGGTSSLPHAASASVAVAHSNICLLVNILSGSLFFSSSLIVDK